MFNLLSALSYSYVFVQIIVISAMEVWSDGIPVPGLMVANTDTIHYQHLCVDCVYRFSPVYVREGETDWFHGVDEQVEKTNKRNKQHSPRFRSLYFFADIC